MIARSRAITLAAICNFFLVAFTVSSFAQSAAGGGQSAPWARAAIAHAQRMRKFPDENRKAQQTPPVIPELVIDRDPTGMGLIQGVFSYCGQITVTATSCRKQMPDPAFYSQCLQDSFDELKSAAAGKSAVRKPRAVRHAHADSAGHEIAPRH